MNDRQRVTIETNVVRQQAVALLASLEEAHRNIKAQLDAEQRPDMMRLVAGRSSLEQAIADTRRAIAAIDRTMEDARDAAESGGVIARIGFARHAMSM